MKRSLFFIAAYLCVIFCCPNPAAADSTTPVVKSIGIYHSYSVPAGDLKDDYEGLANLGIKLGIGTGNYGLELALTSYDFEDKNGSDDLSIGALNLSFFAVVSDIGGSIYPYASAGVGQYMPNRGSDGFGTNAGLGVIVKLTKEVYVDVIANYHIIFNDSDGTSFYNVRTGINMYYF